MDCAVIYSEAALDDLQEITAYIAADNVEVAKRFANRLVDLAESLRNMPGKGRSVKGWPKVCDCAFAISDFLPVRRAGGQSGSVAILARRT
jgi:plasmid stabilization system protein ParE